MSLLQKTIRADVQATQAYAVASSVGMVKLDAMENPQGMPETLLHELAQQLMAAELNRYPEPKALELESALRACTDLPKAAQVLFGNGSDELIDLIIRACCMPGDVVLSPVPTFVMYAQCSQWSHAKFIGVDLNNDFTLNMPAMLKNIATNRPKVVFLAYPNNPTGVALREAEIVQIIEVTPGLVVVDEAYVAFAETSFMARVLEFPNVLVLRTFSKLGLAGARLGYAVASPAWIEQIDKVRPPYNINVLTRIVVQFALQHFEVFQTQTRMLCEQREVMIEALSHLRVPQGKIEVFDSHANFVLFRTPNALDVFEALKNKGILVKYVGKAHPLLINCLRVTVSTEHENQQFLAALQQSIDETSTKAA
jgi:histidinol-phosphate aminotransferase